MWTHYFLTLYRSLARHRLYAALNVLGLAVGIAVFLVLTLDVRFETGFDRWLPEAANTYRLDETIIRSGTAPVQDADTSSVIAPLLAADYPQIVAAARLVESDTAVALGDRIDSEEVNHVDPDFLTVIALPLAQGAAATALSQAGDIVISERIARKYFGSVHVVGRNLSTIEDGGSILHRVSAVMRDLPRDTHLDIDILEPLTPAFEADHQAFVSWHSESGFTYVRFRNQADARAVQADLPAFLDRRAAGDSKLKLGPDPSKKRKLRLVPLPAIHFKDADTLDSAKPGVDARVVAALGLVGVFALLIAALNYVNLATARSALRAREVAMRKVLGATRPVLLAQFLAEAIAMTFLAALAGCALTELALPAMNAAGGTSLTLHYWGPDGMAPAILVLTLVIGLAAGLYPALVLANFQPAEILSAARMPGGGRLGGRVRAALVALQFAAAIIVGISTLVIGAQAKFMHDADRGFKRDGLILVDSLEGKELDQRQGAILDALRATPGVERVTVSDREPASGNDSFSSVTRPGWTGVPAQAELETVGPDYAQTYGAALVAGRMFDAAHADDDIADLDDQTLQAQGHNVLINERAVKAFGFRDAAAAIGQRVRARNPGTIVGVLRDMRFMSPRQPIDPTIYSYDSRQIEYGVAAVRYHGVDTPEMMQRMREAWRRLVPEEPFVARTAEARLSNYYVPDEQRARLFTIGAVLAMAVGCLGLYGLASFTTARRVKEIGIRKTLGASTADILRLLIGQFLRPVLVANLVAWPLAFFAMRSWLSGFDQRIGLSPLYFLAATLLTLVIALATVTGQALAVARAEPAKALRHE